MLTVLKVCCFLTNFKTKRRSVVYVLLRVINMSLMKLLLFIQSVEDSGKPGLVTRRLRSSWSEVFFSVLDSCINSVLIQDC